MAVVLVDTNHHVRVHQNQNVQMLRVNQLIVVLTAGDPLKK